MIVTRRVRDTLLAAGLLAALAGCTPLYVPLVPEAPPVPAVARLSDASRLELVEGRPRLVLGLAAAGATALEQGGAWLDVQWFAPAGAQAASESVWLMSAGNAEELTFDLPADVLVVPGEWRAVVSLDGMVLRQFRVDVAADPEE